MPQIENGPKGLNSILESAYANAISSGKSKESASKIAWGAAKQSYEKKGEHWVHKFYEDLGVLVLALNKVVSKSDAKDYEYFLYPLEQFAKEIADAEEENPVEWLNVDNVMLNPAHNPVDPKIIESIKGKVKESGEVVPLVYVRVDNDGVDQKMIADGYHRYLALKEIGYKLIPARMADERGTKTTENDKPVKLMVTEKFEKKDDRVEWLPVDEFFLNPYHTPANRSIVDEKKQKIQETGKVKPLLYSEIDNSGKIDKIIVDGYHRFIALKELGYDKVPAIHINEDGVRVSDDLDRVKLRKIIADVDVPGLELDRQDLQGKPRKPKHNLDDGMVIGKSDDSWSSGKSRAFAFDPNSTENEGRFRLYPPSKINQDTYFRRKSSTDGVSYVMGKDSAGKETIQAIRFDKEKMPEDKAKAWWGKNKGKYSFYSGVEKGGPGSGRTPEGGTEYLKPSSGHDPASITDNQRFIHLYNQTWGRNPEYTQIPKTHAHMQRSLSSLQDELKLHGKTEIGKGGEGSGRHPENPLGRVDDIDAQIEQHKQDFRSGKIKAEAYKRRVEPLYALKQRTGHFSGQTVKPISTPYGMNKGGPGSGRHPEGKTFEEPFHSQNHVKQFLQSNNVVIGSVDRSELSPEKNVLRQQEFEGHLQSKGTPYKAVQGNYEGKPEKSYIISAPEKEQAQELHDHLSRKYNQDSVVHVRNGHATLQHKDGSVYHANINDLKGGDLTSNYTEADGQRFQIPFKF